MSRDKKLLLSRLSPQDSFDLQANVLLADSPHHLASQSHDNSFSQAFANMFSRETQLSCHIHSQSLTAGLMLYGVQYLKPAVATRCIEGLRAFLRKFLKPSISESAYAKRDDPLSQIFMRANVYWEPIGDEKVPIHNRIALLVVLLDFVEVWRTAHRVDAICLRDQAEVWHLRLITEKVCSFVQYYISLN